MTRVTDWSELGILPLQDHDDEEAIDLRFAVVGARVTGKDDASGASVIGKQSGQGTVGTVHPWRYFPTVGRETRAMGSWSMAMPGVATSDAQAGGASPHGTGASVGGSVVPGMRGETRTVTGKSSLTLRALPVRRDDYKPDERFEEVTHKLPDGYEGVQEGDLVVLMAGTDEDGQEDLAYPLSPQVLIAPNVNGPSERGTKVYDLDPGGKVSESRWARLQSMMRVVLFPDEMDAVAKRPGYGLALQHTGSGQGLLAGYGACYGQVDGSGAGGGPEAPDPDPYGLGGGLSGGLSYNGGTSNMRRNVPGANPDPHHPNKWAGVGPGIQGPPGGG